MDLTKVKKAFVILIILMIALTLINISITNATVYNDFSNQVFSLSITNDGKEIYNTENIQAKYRYNTIWIPMNEVFSYVFLNYKSDDEIQKLTYNLTNLEINKNINIISIPNVYNVNTNQINNTVDVEIEQINGIEYIPIYLIANIQGIEVSIDNKEVYKRNSYYNAINAVNTTQTTHSIVIKLDGEIENKTITSTEYVGEEQGALWREEAYKRIEKYRKNDVNIVVKNQNGKEITNAIIDVKMKNNEFKFGTAIRMVEKTKQNKWDNITRNLFNAVGSENGFKWGILNSNGRDIPNEVINYAKDNDMHIRGHYLWTDRVLAETRNLIGDLSNPQDGTMAYVYTQYNNENLTEEESNNKVMKIRDRFEEIVLNHIENEMVQFNDIQEWDVINEPIAQQYFKYYLYDKQMLSSSEFATTTTKYIKNYTDNDDYYKFLAKCFDKAKQTKKNSKLTLNDNKVTGNSLSTQLNQMIRIVNNVKKYTNNIDALGIQYHVYNNYRFTPQSYYNQINYTIEQTGINDVVVTEYDNYVTSKKNQYTNAEKEEKANYLKDTLISVYSNPNISGFNFWVYNSGTGSFVEEEWQAYEELMQRWLNDEKSGTTNVNGEYSARLYKGEYTANIKVNNITEEIPIKVTDNMDSIEVVINSNIKKIKVKQKPNKTEYIQNFETLNTSGGVITAYYEDGTTEEISMNSNEVNISEMDNSILGNQTITVTYKQQKVTFVVNVVEKNIKYMKITKLPDQLNYIKNEEIDLTGGEVTIYYNDNTTEIIEMTRTEVNVTGFNNTVVGKQKVTLYCLNHITTFEININEKNNNQPEENSENIEKNNNNEKSNENKNEDTNKNEIKEDNKSEANSNKQEDVKENKERFLNDNDTDSQKIVTKIIVKQLPKKMQYVQNYDMIDLTGGIIEVNYSDGTSQEIAMTNNKIKVEGYVNKYVGKINIKIIYDEKVTSFSVTIVDKQIENIELKSIPTKTIYRQDVENLDTNGGILQINYNDGTTEEIDMQNNNEILTKGFDNTILGEKAIIVNYKGKITTYVVNIIENSIIPGKQDETIAEKELPATGLKTVLIIAIIALGSVACMSGKKYKQYIKDTKKQL